MPKRPSDRTAAPPALDAPAEQEQGEPQAGDARLPIVGIGASAGGLEAFTELLGQLPLDTGMAFVLVQHLDPQHESALTQLLGRATSLPVHEVTDAMRIEANHVYVIPPNTNLGIAAGVLQLEPRGSARTANRSIDFFFEALAADQRECAIGVVLSGTATDGTLGLEAIKAEGGITFAQDGSARYDSMPRSAAAAGCVDFVLSPAGIAAELARIAKHPSYPVGAALEPEAAPENDRASASGHEDAAAPLPSGGSGTPDDGAERSRAEAGRSRGQGAPDEGFKRALVLLRNHSRVDFSLYKSNTIERRILRRMVLGRHDTLEDYARTLKGNAKELEALYSDVLISVTSFFRNPEAFEVLQHKVLPELLAQRGDEPLRIWVLGCSTGQEAYSIAMAYCEAADKAPRAGRRLQVFATDLNEALLDKARQGLYAKSLAADLSPERLRRFFAEEGGGYRIGKPLREMVVFARQNLISDPPFSRMDLVSCRNLLIYLEPGVQKRVFPTFHYALKPEGFLWLGASESIGGFTELFEPLDRKHKFYTRKAAHTPALALLAPSRRGEHGFAGPYRAGTVLAQGAGPGAEGLRGELDAQREADRITINQFAPPGVLINAELQILQFRGATGAYLELPAGKASLDVLKMAREGLMLPLRSAIEKARKENNTVRKEKLRVVQGGTTRETNLEVIPLKNLRERCFLVVFEDPKAGTRPAAPGAEPPAARTSRAARSDELSRTAELETALAETREYLKAVQEDNEASNEELQAAGEEVQSANEELQSLNEELTTSKEELESSNEELSTLNEEMSHRNAELGLLAGDLINVQSSSHLVILLLGRDLRIRRFSTQAEKHFHLLAADIGRPIGNIRHRLEVPELEALVTEVIDTVHAQEREVHDQDGRWYSLRVRPYLTLDNKVDGAVLVLVDIDAVKRSEQALRESEARLRAMFDTTSVGVTEADPETGRLLSANEQFARLVGCSAAELVGKSFIELTHPQDRPGNWEGFSRLVRGEIASYEVETRLLRKDSTAAWVHVTVNLVRDAAGRALHTVAFTLDIGERRRAQKAAAHLAAIVTSSGDAIIGMGLDGTVTSWNPGAQHLFGYTAEEALGQPMSLLIPAARSDEEPGILERIRHGETVAAYETVRRRKDGGLIDVSLTVSPILDATGRVRGAAKIARDITERMRVDAAVHESEERYRTLFDSIDEGFCVIDVLFDAHDKAVDYRFVSVNPSFEKHTGLRGATGKRMRELAPDHEAHWFETYGKVALTGESVRFVNEANALDGRWFDVYAFRLGRPENRRVAILFTDITERRRAETDLREADRHKSEFLAMLAHELRNPLAPIRNALEIMRRTGAGAAAAPAGATQATLGPHAGDTFESARQMVERQVAQMVRLVDDLLDLSRISRGKIYLRCERVALAAVVQQAVQTARPGCTSKGHELTVELPARQVVLNADPARLVQIIGNLLNNACKFTDHGGGIAITVAVDDPAPRAAGVPHAVIRVRDSGIGIAADELPRIFQMFTQVDSSLGRSAGGLGIGLALVKDLVALHGGTVAVHSAGLGQGSEFEVRLPIEREDAPATAAAAPTEPAATPPRRILVVDDNRDAAESLAFLLQMEGHETHMAHDGLEAVAAAATLQPEVILLDIGLPGIDGYEAARRIRAQRPGDGLLLVALTGRGQEEDRRRSAQAGFDAHLVKPVPPETLLSLLGQAPAALVKASARLTKPL